MSTIKYKQNYLLNNILQTEESIHAFKWDVLSGIDQTDASKVSIRVSSWQETLDGHCRTQWENSLNGGVSKVGRGVLYLKKEQF